MRVANRIVAHCEVAPETLVPHPQNFRRHPSEQVDALRGSMRELGWVKTVLINRTTGHVIDGHARIEEARRQNLPTIPVTYVELSEEEERLALTILDPISEMAFRDEEAIRALLASVETEDAALTALLEHLGKAASTTMGLLPGIDPDDAPPVPAEPITQVGDLLLLGDHRLLCGDATSGAAWATLMGDRTADVLWTDPPYGVGYVGKTADHLTIENDTVDGLESLLVTAFSHARQHTTGGTPFYIAAPAGPAGIIFRSAIVQSGLRFHQSLAWVKDSMVLGHSDYHYRHEDLLYGWMPGEGRAGRGNHPGSRWEGDHAQTTVLEFDRPKRSEEHPTMKPVALIAYCLGNSSRPGSLVLDPFAGSGSTIIAAEQEHRRCYAMEIDPRYTDVIASRWEQATGRVAERIRGGQDG